MGESNEAKIIVQTKDSNNIVTMVKTHKSCVNHLRIYVNDSFYLIINIITRSTKFLQSEACKLCKCIFVCLFFVVVCVLMQQHLRLAQLEIVYSLNNMLLFFSFVSVDCNSLMPLNSGVLKLTKIHKINVFN